jgi:hypothetical protein
LVTFARENEDRPIEGHCSRMRFFGVDCLNAIVVVCSGLTTPRVPVPDKLTFHGPPQKA